MSLLGQSPLARCHAGDGDNDDFDDFVEDDNDDDDAVYDDIHFVECHGIDVEGS